MKSSKKFKILFMLILLLSVAFTNSAAAANGTGTITINKPEHLSLEGKTISAYQIFDAAWDGKEAFSYTIRDAYRDGGPMEAMLTSLLLDPEGADLTRVAADLWSYIDTHQIAASGTAVGTAAATVTITDLPYGYYLLYGAGLAEGNVEVYGVASLTTLADAAVVKVKADAPAIDKKVFNDNVGVNGWSDWSDLNIGDTAEFQLTSRVPDMQGYTNYTFKVTDTLSAGLTLNMASIRVKINDQVISPAGHYTVSAPQPGMPGSPTVFQIAFDTGYFTTLQKDAPVNITYSAMLNEHALINGLGNTNTVQLEYSNNPYFDSTGITKEATVVVYTFEINAYKYTGDLLNNPTPLAGAKFKLKQGSSKGSEIAFYHEGNGVYHAAKSGEAPVTTTIISPVNGKLKLQGLDAGTYYLEEIEAPAGYNKLTVGNVITISHSAAGQTAIMTVDGKESNTVNIRNSSGIILPGTGGRGRKSFYLAGGILTIGLAVFFFGRKRKLWKEK